ncbi:MAG: ABC transporter permease [Defluviitaleaceae bacterium]|nr:ABC transporter permease [Defluviitaleaceae bacterium]
MNRYLVFLEKEITENIRTKKLLVLACVFLFFGLTSPLLARYMAELFEFLMPAAEAELFMMFMPAAVWPDSYTQFYSNISQTGAIVIIFMFMGLVLREKRSGTADLVFCKGVSPAPFILAKFTVSAVVSLLCLAVAILINYGYTVFLFEEGGQIGYVLAGAAAYGVFLTMLISWVVLASTLAKSTAGSAAMGFLGFIGILTVGALPRVGRFLPTELMTNNVSVTLGNFYPDFAAHLFIAAGMAAVFLGLAIIILKKQEL